MCSLVLLPTAIIRTYDNMIPYPTSSIIPASANVSNNQARLIHLEFAMCHIRFHIEYR